MFRSCSAVCITSLLAATANAQEKTKPDHVHMLIRRHRDTAETMIEHFQNASRAALCEVGKREAPHPVWTAGPGWKTFINTQYQFVNEIEYIRRNPLKNRWPEQRWAFVQPYNGWMPGYRG